MVATLKLRTTLMETSLDQLLLITAIKVWLVTMKRFSDQLCALCASKPYLMQLSLSTRTSGVMVPPFSPKTDTLLASSKARSRLARLALTYQSQCHYQCSRSLVTKQACGALLTSTAKAQCSSIHNGRRSLLGGRKSQQKPRNWQQTSQQ